LLALCLGQPVLALGLPDGIQTLEWSDGTASGTTGATETDPAASHDVWQRIRNGFRIDDDAAAHPLVAVHEAWYAARPAYVRRMVERSRRYLYHIVQEVDRRGMPMEVALLPMIESAFNPVALSPSAASGIWQFIPSTGRLYGLKQDSWYDGRRDFTAATNAALDYLGKLYLDFGDWQLALAAYNCGEGCVARAIQKNVQQGLPTDYASLTLPNETRHYVPKLLAVRNLVRNPEQYGVAIDTLPNQPYFNQVTVNASMDVHSAARLADMSSDEFLALNAAFPRKLIRSDTPVSLLVPVDKADQFQRNLAAGNWDSWQPHVARKGERPGAIAKRFGVTLARLEEHNQFHLKRGKLVRDQTILVPVKGRAVATAVQPQPRAIPETASHEVQRGETLFAIARKYGLSVAELSAANPDLDAVLRPGQMLRVPASAEALASPVQHVSFKARVRNDAPARHYTVQRGDSLHAIAARFDVSLDDLKAWNPRFRKSSRVLAGQRVVVREP
jgi:membrane-bound lytic murein transglycosylase D